MTNRTWGGRFERSPAEAMLLLSASVDVDKELAEDDLVGSMAWARALERAGVLTPSERAAIVGGLEAIGVEVREGRMAWSAARAAPVIPRSAARATDHGYVAYVVEGDVARERVLKLGMSTKDGFVEVRTGLADGDLLVVRGAEALSDGVKVRASKVDAAAIARGGPDAGAPSGSADPRADGGPRGGRRGRTGAGGAAGTDPGAMDPAGATTAAP